MTVLRWVSVAVALADKIDTLTGFWAIDEKPTGSKDPYALRRAALGVIRIVEENRLRLNLDRFIDAQILRHKIGINRPVVGDDVIVTVDGQPVVETRDLIDRVSATPPGEPITQRSSPSCRTIIGAIVVRGRRRLGFEFKRTVSPRPTKSTHIALADLRLERVHRRARHRPRYRLPRAWQRDPRCRRS